MLRAKTVRSWYLTHKWTSIACTLLSLMACVTGLPLIFHQELNDYLRPHVRAASVPVGTPPASLDRMVAVARARVPSSKPFALEWDEDEPRVFVSMSPSEKPDSTKFHSLIFDEHTGSLLQETRPGQTALLWILKLHSELFMGTAGELLMGAMGTLFVASLLSGALVYGPFMRRLPFGTYRRNARRRTAFLDLHNLLGIVTLVWTLVVGGTGIINALSDVLFDAWRAQTMPALVAPFRGQPLPTVLTSLDKAVIAAQRATPGMAIDSVVFPNSVMTSPRHYLIWAKGQTPLTSRLFTPVLVNAATGQVQTANPLPWYLRALEVSRPLHFGDYGGLALKVLWAVLDLLTIIVLLSGLYLWLQRGKRPIERELDELVKRSSERQTVLA